MRDFLISALYLVIFYVTLRVLLILKISNLSNQYKMKLKQTFKLI